MSFLAVFEVNDDPHTTRAPFPHGQIQTFLNHTHITFSSYPDSNHGEISSEFSVHKFLENVSSEWSKEERKESFSARTIVSHTHHFDGETIVERENSYLCFLLRLLSSVDFNILLFIAFLRFWHATKLSE